MHAGGAVCVPIVDTVISVTTTSRGVVGHGRKDPVLFLVFRKHGITPIDLCGRVYELGDVEQRFPGAISKAKVLALSL